jgi:hypothetical protein
MKCLSVNVQLVELHFSLHRKCDASSKAELLQYCANKFPRYGHGLKGVNL